MSKKLNQMVRQLIIYDVLTTFEKTSYGDIKFVLPLFDKRTLQRDIKDLTDAGLVAVKYSMKDEGYIWTDEPSGQISESALEKSKPRRIEHLKRLRRLVTCMYFANKGDAKELYFEYFPESTKRMWQRDFDVLKDLGYEITYDRYDNKYYIDNSYVSAFDGYGVIVKDGKMRI